MKFSLAWHTPLVQTGCNIVSCSAVKVPGTLRWTYNWQNEFDKILKIYYRNIKIITSIKTVQLYINIPIWLFGGNVMNANEAWLWMLMLSNLVFMFILCWYMYFVIWMLTNLMLMLIYVSDCFPCAVQSTVKSFSRDYS